MSKQYSKIYRGKFRYNYTECELEYISATDFKFDEDNKLVEIQLDEPMVIDGVGLSFENWKEDREYWMDRYQLELDEMVAIETQWEVW